MTDREWRGPEALNNADLANDFWSAVAEPAKPEDYEVDKVITLEVTHDGEVLARKMVRVTEVVKDEKGTHVQFDYLGPDEPFEDSGVVLVVPQT